ncbi:hypothetical protein D0T85_13410 [Bacteroides sp. 519]|nr:hypothetical protein [Bacteroides sp. 519]
MMWQEWIVGIVVLLCVIEVTRRVIVFFRSAKNNNPCANCTSGCDLKQLFEDKQQQCRSQQCKSNKKCCG